MKIQRRRDLQWSRYSTRFGQIAVSRIKRTVGFIPAHSPVISVTVTRQQAAQGLREWRNMQEVAL